MQNKDSGVLPFARCLRTAPLPPLLFSDIDLFHLEENRTQTLRRRLISKIHHLLKDGVTFLLVVSPLNHVHVKQEVSPQTVNNKHKWLTAVVLPSLVPKAVVSLCCGLIQVTTVKLLLKPGHRGACFYPTRRTNTSNNSRASTNCIWHLMKYAFPKKAHSARDTHMHNTSSTRTHRNDAAP